MPEHLLVGEERKLFYQHNFVTYEDEEYQNLCLELREKHNYDNLPLEEKFKIWEVDREEEKIEALKERVEVCRKFLIKIHAEHMAMIENNKRLMGKVVEINPSLLKKIS